MFASIEGATHIGKLEELDKFRIVVPKLMDAGILFHKVCLELHEMHVSLQRFKGMFFQRLKNTHIDQQHFMQLQTARQKKSDSPQQFGNRCRDLSQKVLCKTCNPAAQRTHCENAE